MAAIGTTEVGNGYYRVNLVWPKNTEIKVTLTLTDPDGDIDEREFEWKAQQDYPLEEALDAIIGAIDALPHWRAIRSGTEISIGAADSDYGYSVDVEIK